MTLLVLMAAPKETDNDGGDHAADDHAADEAATDADGTATRRGGKSTRPVRPFQGRRVDKYFGTRLPPVCARLGCYVTDDGTRFYCVNSACQKHKKRATKHTRAVRPTKEANVRFRCPRCWGQDVAVESFTKSYQCRGCDYKWRP